MKKIRSILTCALTFLALNPSSIFAEDIDLYYGGTAGGDPNLLIVLDNESNWAQSGVFGSTPIPADAITLCGDANKANTMWCAQKYALITLLQKTKNGSYVVGENVGIGIMMYGSGTNKGGYLRFGIRKMTPTNRAALISLLTNMPTSDKGGSQQDFGLMMWEAFKYFGGGVVPTGQSWSWTSWGPIPTNGVSTGTDSRDYANNSDGGSAFSAGAREKYAYTSASTNNTSPAASPPVKYDPPAHTDPCGKNFIVYVGHSESQANDSLGGTFSENAQAMFIGVGGKATRVPSGSASSGDEAARYLFNSDVDPNTAGVQNVVTYTIGTYGAPATGQQLSMITTMRSMATQGGGSYYDATDIGKLADDFEDILTKIQGINSVFVSATLPVSVNTQGTYLNQVFIGMFRPDSGGSPDWLGNLKQYKLKYDAQTNTLRLADSANADAIDGGTGLLAITANSFWTTVSTFWTNWVGTSRTDSKSVSDSPDGPFVEKGGTAQRQRETNLTTQANRKVYTCPLDSNGNGACVNGTALTGTSYKFAMNAGNTAPEFATFAAAKLAPAFNLPTATDTNIADLINWVRGTDNLGNEGGPGGTTTVRPTIHGDVLHSRPVALNFAGRVVTFYGSNEGMLRAVEGKQTGTGAGEELWAFFAPEFLQQQNRLRTQSPQVVLPSSTTDTSTNKSYALDGPIGAYQEGSTAIIYVSARRGGNFIYAIDVSNPDAPVFKFKIAATGSFSNLGQTWSAPKVMKVRDGASGRVVLIFGGGYDVSEDTNTHGTLGRGVYVVDALDGSFITRFLTTPSTDPSGAVSISTSVPSEIAIVDSDRDGFIDRGYVGDMDGNIWRMDLDDGTTSNPSSNWKLHKLASLGARKFFYPPDVVLTSGFAAVIIGSGDREKPLSATSSDRIYMVKDAKIGLDGSAQTTIVQADLVSNTTATTTELAAAKGWFYDLRTGEKVVNGPLTVGGVVYLGTNRPTPGEVCTGNLGEARSYALDFFTGAGTRTPGGAGTGDDAYSEVLSPLTGLPPSPVAGLVDIGGTIVPFCIGCGDRRSALEAGVPDIDPSPFRTKIFWKFKNDK
jgi:type IV pilus assembly protein PilY1